MWGVVRRPGELRVEAVPPVAGEVLGGANGSREALLTLPLLAGPPECVEPWLERAVLFGVPAPAAGLDFCGRGAPRRPGRSMSCMSAGSGGSELFRGRVWLVAPELFAGGRAAFDDEVAPPPCPELFGDRFGIPCCGRFSPPQLNQFGRNERLGDVDESARCVDAGLMAYRARPAAGSIDSRDQPGRKPLACPSTMRGSVYDWAKAALVNSVPSTRPLATKFQ
jgi:hypothetical protein